MLTEKINNVEEELLVSIYKAIEIYDVIKNTRLKVNNKRINNLDKKYLSLLLGISLTKNNVSKILNILRYDYGIQVYTSYKTEEVYENIYENNFKEILDNMLNDGNNRIEDFMLKLIEEEFIKSLHNSKGISLMPLKLLLNESLKNREIPKTLQKK